MSNKSICSRHHNLSSITTPENLIECTFFIKQFETIIVRSSQHKPEENNIMWVFKHLNTFISNKPTKTICNS